MRVSPAPRAPGWGDVALDTLIATLLPSVCGFVFRLAVPEGTILLGALLAFQLLAFHLIGKVRGRAGLVRHLARVVAAMAALSLIMGRHDLTGWALGLPVLAACAALGGWSGSRRA